VSSSSAEVSHYIHLQQTTRRFRAAHLSRQIRRAVKDDVQPRREAITLLRELVVDLVFVSTLLLRPPRWASTHNRNRLLVVRPRTEVRAGRIVEDERAVVRVRLLRPHEGALKWGDRRPGSDFARVQGRHVRRAHDRADLSLEGRHRPGGARRERRRRAAAADPGRRVRGVRARLDITRLSDARPRQLRPGAPGYVRQVWWRTSARSCRSSHRGTSRAYPCPTLRAGLCSCRCTSCQCRSRRPRSSAVCGE
jgi:hypothetical protein